MVNIIHYILSEVRSNSDTWNNKPIFYQLAQSEKTQLKLF